MFKPYIKKCIAIMVMLLGLSACTINPLSSKNIDDVVKVDLFLLSVDAQRAYQQSRWFDAVRLYQQIVEHVPADASAWFRLANTYAQQGAYERAIYAYEQSLTHNSEQPKAWFNLSTAYILHAKGAMEHSRIRLAAEDPARKVIQHRMNELNNLVLGVTKTL